MENVVKSGLVEQLLFIMHPRERRELADYMYEVIKHGDDEHKKWLRDKVNEVFEVGRS